MRDSYVRKTAVGIAPIACVCFAALVLVACVFGQRVERQRTRPPNASAQMGRGGEPAKTGAVGDGFTLRGSMAWLEVNGRGLDPFALWPDAVGVYDGITMLEYCDRGIRGMYIAGLRVAMITTKRAEIVPIYTHLGATWSRRGVQIIGGVKTYAYFTATSNPASGAKDYAITDPAGWLDLRDDCEQIAMLTGVELCVVESETALSNWHRGVQEIDLEKLATAIAPLIDSPVTYLFNLPSVIQTSGRTDDETAAMVEVFAAVPRSVFLTGHNSRPKYVDHPEKQARRDRMLRILGDRTRLWGKCYTGAEPDGGEEFGLEAAVSHFDTISEKLVLYPGGANWGETGRAAYVLTAKTRPGFSR